MNYPSPISNGVWADFMSKRISPWEEWFAWYPVKIHNKRVWLKKIYRRMLWTREDVHIFMNYQYGTLLDVLKTSQ